MAAWERPQRCGCASLHGVWVLSRPQPITGGTCCGSACGWEFTLGRCFVFTKPLLARCRSERLSRHSWFCSCTALSLDRSGAEAAGPVTGGTNPARWMVRLHVCCVCESPFIQNVTRAKEQNKSLSKIARNKGLENLLFISFKSPWRLLLREEI